MPASDFFGESGVFQSAFTLYRIGPGPSSSRTTASQNAAVRFVHELAASGRFEQTARVDIHLLGALGVTGRDIGVDQAIVAGLSGEHPERCDAEKFAARFRQVKSEGQLALDGRHSIPFDPQRQIRFSIGKAVEDHPNALRFDAYDAAGQPLVAQLYVCQSNGEAMAADGDKALTSGVQAPFLFNTAEELLALGRQRTKKIAELARTNECSLRSPGEVRVGLMQIALNMRAAIQRGLSATGALPGTGAKRRAADQAIALGSNATPAQTCALYATAVAEENAAGGRVVSAPTHGAAGPVAALLEFWRISTPLASDERIIDFLLAGAAVANLVRNIGLRQAGCQSVVGVGSAMAAAGYTATLGGSNLQVLFAAERALDRHLGLGCDSVEGRIQQPCIERNAAGAAAAYAAAHEAIRHPDPRSGIDRLVRVMIESGRGMAERYKTASLSGVAVNVADC
jgi:L-serine dehydratase